MTTLRYWPGSRTTPVTPIGLDVSPKRVRAAQLERRVHGWHIARITRWNRRGDEIGVGVSDGFARRIRQSFEQERYQGRTAILGLSLPDIELHALELHTADFSAEAHRGKTGVHDDEALRAVRRELERIMSIPANEAVCTFWNLPPSKTRHSAAVGVAARRSDIQAAWSLAKNAGLECDCVDATSCALSRLGVAIGWNGEGAPNVWAILDLGARMLRIVVCMGETPALVRTLGNGGQAWTEAVAESLGLTVDAAEVHKIDYGIAASNSSDAQSSEIASMIHNILRLDLEGVVSEIERSYEYVLRCYPDRTPGGLLLAGGGADMKGFANYLSEKLGIEVRGLDDVVRQADSPITVEPNFRESLNSYACALGLAIEADIPT